MSALLFTALLAAAPPLATADVIVDGKKAFRLERTRRVDARGAEHLTSTFFDTAGKVALRMDARLEHGHPAQVIVEQRQSKERGKVELSPGRVRFEVRTPSGARETSESDALGIVYVGPALTTWITSDGPWRRLLAGEAVEFKVAAWRRMSVYSFRLEPIEGGDPKHLVLAMEPTNVIYRAFAGDMRYTFDRATRRHLRYEGITALKRADEDGDLEDVTAKIVFRDK